MKWKNMKKRLKATRESNRISRKDVEKATNNLVVERTLKEYERKGSKVRVEGMRIETLCALADLYGVSTDYLLMRTDHPALLKEETVDALGLSEKALIILKRKKNNKAFNEVLNFLIESESVNNPPERRFLSMVTGYLCTSILKEQYIGFKKEGVSFDIDRKELDKNFCLNIFELESILLGGYMNEINSCLKDLREEFSITGRREFVTSSLSKPTLREKRYAEETKRAFENEQEKNKTGKKSEKPLLKKQEKLEPCVLWFNSRRKTKVMNKQYLAMAKSIYEKTHKMF